MSRLIVSLFFFCLIVIVTSQGTVLKIKSSRLVNIPSIDDIGRPKSEAKTPHTDPPPLATAHSESSEGKASIHPSPKMRSMKEQYTRDQKSIDSRTDGQKGEDKPTHQKRDENKSHKKALLPQHAPKQMPNRQDKSPNRTESSSKRKRYSVHQVLDCEHGTCSARIENIVHILSLKKEQFISVRCDKYCSNPYVIRSGADLVIIASRIRSKSCRCMARV